jgi:hypothetical protein
MDRGGDRVAKRKKRQVSGMQALAGLSAFWIVLAIFSGAVFAWIFAGIFTATTAGVAVRRRGGRKGRAKPPPRGRGRTPASGRARPGRAPKRAPLTGHSDRVGSRSPFASARCSLACRSSRKPAFDKAGRLTCDCPCRGSQHGLYQPGSTAHTVRTDKDRQRARARATVGAARSAAGAKRRDTRKRGGSS